MSAVLPITDLTRTSFNVAEGPKGDIDWELLRIRFETIRDFGLVLLRAPFDIILPGKSRTPSLIAMAAPTTAAAHRSRCVIGSSGHSVKG